MKIWWILFVAIFILSIDVWNWNKGDLGVLGIPLWIYYFMFLQLLLAFVIWMFSKHWGDGK